MRATWPGGAIPVFDRVTIGGTPYLVPSHGVARRYFAGEAEPPSPPVDLFAASKPARAFRVFVLGESSAAGFPYPRNGTFSRVLRDALRDVLPGDSVEVVNLGIAATNSYTVADLVPAVIAQHPDAVLIYAGHNEYYGALGVGSSVGIGASPTITRAYLAAEHLRTFMALRRVAAAVTRRIQSSRAVDSTVATFMETIARDQEIALSSPEYRRGLSQFHDNISAVLGQFRENRVPVYLASIESNVRGQPPFVSPDNAPARTQFDSGQAALRRGDTAAGRSRLLRARELDVIRFRAPLALDSAITRLAAAGGARYVPVAEHLDSLSPAGLPGPELFLEHVHPNARGYAEIAHVFFDALRRDGFLGHAADLSRLASWDEYRRRMALTPFDERIVAHSVATVTTRWPFVSRADARDYRGTYRPVGLVDSLALLVSRGGLAWSAAKLQVGAAYERTGHPDSAAAEYLGLVRDAGYLALPNRLAGRALVAAGRPGEAVPLLERAMRIEPSSDAATLLGVVAMQRHQPDVAIALLDQAVRLAPTDPGPVYQLSLAFGLAKQLDAARGAAARAARLDPGYPGLAQWMRLLGMRAAPASRVDTAAARRNILSR